MKVKEYKYYNNKYYVDKNGNIYNKKMVKLNTFNSKYRDGYKTIILRGYDEDGKLHRCGVSVHSMVAKSWIPYPNDGKIYEVHHKDGDRANSHVDNLEWVTHSENIKYSIIEKTHFTPKWDLENNPKSKLKVEDVKSIRKMYENGISIKDINKIYNSVKENSIKNIIERKTWSNI